MAKINAAVTKASRLSSALAAIAQVLAADQILTDQADCLSYGSDNSRLLHPPDAVVLPTTEREVAAVVAIAYQNRIPLNPRGRGTATTGASLAEQGGITLATDWLASRLDIDPVARSATVAPGVLNGELQAAAGLQGLFWPPDPSSSAYCSVGGNLATAAAGPRGLKYGGTRENVLGLRAVTGTGAVISCGSASAKCVAGYDLGRLIIGSEGTLAVITEAVLRLVPKPGARRGLMAGFDSAKAALQAAGAIMACSATPAALEFLDEGCLNLIGSAAGARPDGAALLIIETEGADDRVAAADLASVRAALGRVAGLVDLCAGGAEIWSLRKSLSQRLREVANLKINEDVAVPLSQLVGLVELLSRECCQAGIGNLNFGHAGAGNLHVNLLLDADDRQQKEHARKILGKLFKYVVDCSGAVSGEHGIGLVKREFLPLQVDADTAQLMTGIKRVFDPGGILNPGKIMVR